MSESVKPRFAVDLNDIERQLAHAAAPSAPPAQPTRNDPLAELARIVGQDDPFQSILAADGSARPRQQPSTIDDLFATRDTMTPTPRQAYAPELRGRHDGPAYDLDQYSEAEPLRAETYGYQQASGYQHAAPSQGQDAYRDEDYAQDYYDPNAGHYASSDFGEPERLDYPPVEKPRSRKGMIAIGAIVGAAVLGLGGAYMFGGSSMTASGQPPLIKAGNEPTKVQPQNPGGVEIPNQNKQIYERAANTETKIVNREEQPVDVKQAVRMNGGAAADATGAAVSGSKAQQSAGGLNLGEPRKVRTVTIRPDGTVAHPEGAGQRSGPAPVPTMTLPAQAQPAPAAASPVPSATQVAAVQPVSVPAAPVAATPAPKPAAATPAAAPAPQKVASTQPVPVAAPEPAQEQVAVGGFSVQLGLANSEKGAEAAFAQFQRKYSDLEGLPSLIRQAEVNGNTIYRVRVGPMSREEASALCSKLQGQGGQCFVAKN